VESYRCSTKHREFIGRSGSSRSRWCSERDLDPGFKAGITQEEEARRPRPAKQGTDVVLAPTRKNGCGERHHGCLGVLAGERRGRQRRRD